MEESAAGVTVMRFTATRTLPGQQGCNQPGGEACELLVAYNAGNDHLSMHSDRGSAVLDLEAATLHRVSTRSVRVIWSVHGWLCVIAWGVLIPGAIIVSRTLKDIGPMWIQLHIILNVSGVVVALVGVLVGLAHFQPPRDAKHRQLGIVATALSLFQPIHGFIRPAPNSGMKRTVWEWTHLVVGRASIVIALIATFLGIERYEFITGVDRSHWSYVFGGYLISLFMVYLMLEQRKNKLQDQKLLERIELATADAGPKQTGQTLGQDQGRAGEIVASVPGADAGAAEAATRSWSCPARDSPGWLGVARAQKCREAVQELEATVELAAAQANEQGEGEVVLPGPPQHLRRPCMARDSASEPAQPRSQQQRQRHAEEREA